MNIYAAVVTLLGNLNVPLSQSIMLYYWASLLFFFRFQSEKETGDRNFAIGYYMKEKKVC